GKLFGGQLSVGDEVTVLPSRRISTISGLHFFDQQLETIQQNNSVILSLEDELNVTRGDLIVKSSEIPREGNEISAKVCWMDTSELKEGAKFIVQHNTNQILSKIEQIEHVIATDFSVSHCFMIVIKKVNQTDLLS
ncbi:MAG: sulfate adenylyltransferase, partial [Flavobacteriaceae bacterium]|nr:sulfate adenylyltransferase [Flavobacteriaceae bacterium]